VGSRHIGGCFTSADVSVTILIDGLGIQAAGFNFSQDLGLRLPTEREVTLLRKYDRTVVSRIEEFVALEGSFTFPLDQGFGYFQQLRHKAETAIHSLRLTNGGTLGWQITLYQSSRRDLFEIFPDHECSPQHCACAEGPFVISEDRLRSACDLWSRVKDVLAEVESWGALAVAFHRFSDSYLRHDQSDKLIDLAICLEALFGDSRAIRKKHLIARRATVFLSNCCPFSDSEAIKEKIIELYNTRNAVVHGEITRCSANKVSEWKDLVRSCLRNYILRCSAVKNRSLDFRKKLLDSLDGEESQ